VWLRITLKILIKLAKIYIALMNHFKGKMYLDLVKTYEIEKMTNNANILKRYREAKCEYYMRLGMIDKLSHHVKKLKILTVGSQNPIKTLRLAFY
jgi:hypothetical protein